MSQASVPNPAPLKLHLLWLFLWPPQQNGNQLWSLDTTSRKITESLGSIDNKVPAIWARLDLQFGGVKRVQLSHVFSTSLPLDLTATWSLTVPRSSSALRSYLFITLCLMNPSKKNPLAKIPKATHDLSVCSVLPKLPLQQLVCSPITVSTENYGVFL